MNRVLITGSSGFVGKNLVPYMQERQWKVVGLDQEGEPDLLYRLGSWSNHDQLKEAVMNVDVIVHLASQSHVDRSISGPKQFADDNVTGTLELFEAAKGKRVLLFSTDEVGACLERGEFYETFEYKCGSVYSATKASQEVLAQAYIKTHGSEIVTTRCVNIFGPHQHDEKFIPTVCRHAIHDKPIPIYGSGMQMRQWVSVEKVCETVTEIVASNYVPPGTVIHIPGTGEIPNILLAHMILSHLGRPASLISHVQDRLGHDVRYALGVKSTLDFGFSLYDPTRFPEDLKKTVQHYQERYS